MARIIRGSIMEEAIKLRKQGRTYGQIRNKFQISKSTLSYWFKSIKLSENALIQLRKTQDINLKKARLASISALRVRQENFLKNLRKRLEPMISQALYPVPLKIALAFLYLGEGAKWKSHRGLQLGSSNPTILLLYVRLLKRCYYIDKTSLHCYICYRADQSPQVLTMYWSRTLGIPRKNFYDSKYDRRTLGKPTKNRDYRGVCIISCKGTEVQQELDLIIRMLHEGL